MNICMVLLRVAACVWVLIVGATVAADNYPNYSGPWWIIVACGGATIGLILSRDDRRGHE